MNGEPKKAYVFVYRSKEVNNINNNNKTMIGIIRILNKVSKKQRRIYFLKVTLV